ncbi:AAA family ATPase [Micromonospora sp. DT233]|uniref:AAA family ATPase n=1 Tax=Micromonospora sp. DT233 TaxID=3393432 RepID=UPI003CECBFFE
MPMSTIVNEALGRASAQWPVPEERRTVSVLFADIVGSTALVDRLDPEEVRALQRAYFDTVAGVLGRWGGIVEKYVGDAVMALFGARDSDGFDAYRAVRAGLEIQRVLDGRALPGVAALRTRVGVATGEALVDVAAMRDGAHGTASGAIITAAARLQEHAPPGAVVLCAATRRATAGLIDHRALAPLTVAGKPRPVDVSVAVGVARREPAAHHGRLVGRRRQLACAREQVLRAVRERSPRWVALVGPTGSGRSRMLHELRRAVDAATDTPTPWYVAACPPYPERPLGPVADLLRAFAGVRAEDPPAVVRRRLLAELGALVAPVRALSEAVALEGLLDGSFPGGAAVWQRVLLRRAAAQPVVVAVDDLDRAAPAVHRFLRTLFSAAVSRGLPLAVVSTHGTGRADAGPVDRRTEVPLPPLSAVETGRLLRRLLARTGRPAASAARLLPLVGGLPGHAEAYVRRGADGADPAAELPERVRADAGARLDTCDGPERAVTMVVATLGPAVGAARVERALGWAPGRAGPLLHRLADRGLLRRAASGGYAVEDPALRRVAHDRLPRSVRADVTRLAGPATVTGLRAAARARPPARNNVDVGSTVESASAATAEWPVTSTAARAVTPAAGPRFGATRETAAGPRFGATREAAAGPPVGATREAAVSATAGLAVAPHPAMDPDAAPRSALRPRSAGDAPGGPARRLRLVDAGSGATSTAPPPRAGSSVSFRRATPTGRPAWRDREAAAPGPAWRDRPGGDSPRFRRGQLRLDAPPPLALVDPGHARVGIEAGPGDRGDPVPRGGGAPPGARGGGAPPGARGGGPVGGTGPVTGSLPRAA